MKVSILLFSSFIFYISIAILIWYCLSNYPSLNLTKSLNTTQTMPTTTPKKKSTTAMTKNLTTATTKNLMRTKLKISKKTLKPKKLPSWSTIPSHLDSQEEDCWWVWSQQRNERMSIGSNPSLKYYSFASGVLGWNLYMSQGDSYEEVYIDLFVPILPTCA